MATYEEYLEYLDEKKAARAAARDQEELAKGPGVLGAFKRGLFQASANLGEMGGLGRGPASTSGLRTLEDYRDAPTQAEVYRSGLIAASGESEPVTKAQRVAERMGANAPLYLAGMAGPAALAGIPAGLASMAADIGVSAIGETSQEFGASPAQQLGIEILAGILIPNNIAGKVSKRAAAVLDDFTARKIAKKHSIRVSKVQKAARQAYDEFDIRMSKNPELRRELMDRVRTRGIEDFPDPNARPTTRQAMGERGGQNFSALEELSARRPDVSADIQTRRTLSSRAVDAELASTLPRGTTQGAIDKFDEVMESAKAAERSAWREARASADDLPMISTRRMKAVAKEIAEESVAQRKSIPDEVRIVLGYGDEIDAAELQGLRSESLTTQRLGQKAAQTGSNPTAARKGGRIGRLIDAVEQEVDDLPEEGGRAYKNARRITAQNKQLFNPRSKYVDGLTNSTEARFIASKIKGAKKPVEEIRNARRVLDQIPGGVDDLKATMVEDLIGPDLSDMNPRKALTELKKHRTLYVELFGSEQYQKMNRILEKAKTTRVGRAGTAAATAGTGSGIPGAIATPMDALTAGADLATGGSASFVKKMFGAMVQKVAALGSDPIERNLVIREAMLDPEMFDVLMSWPKPGDEGKWIRRLDNLVKKTQLQQARSAPRVVAPLVQDRQQ